MATVTETRPADAPPMPPGTYPNGEPQSVRQAADAKGGTK